MFALIVHNLNNSPKILIGETVIQFSFNHETQHRSSPLDELSCP